MCIVNVYPEEENIFVWARDVVSELRTPQFSFIPTEYFATYFEWDPIHTAKELESAATSKVTGADVLSFGSQRFKLLLKGLAGISGSMSSGLSESQTVTTAATESDVMRKKQDRIALL